MAETVTYSLRTYTEDCALVEYFTREDGFQGQRTLEGKEKQEALKIVQADMDAVAAGARHTSSLQNAEERRYIWSILPSQRSSWEVKLDAAGNPLPNPCMSPGPSDPRNRKFSFVNGNGSLSYEGREATLVMLWTEINKAEG